MTVSRVMNHDDSYNRLQLAEIKCCFKIRISPTNNSRQKATTVTILKIYTNCKIVGKIAREPEALRKWPSTGNLVPSHSTASIGVRINQYTGGLENPVPVDRIDRLGHFFMSIQTYLYIYTEIKRINQFISII
ncbi:hypothetical protein D917_02811 [Trichinella nativa]|uniref:Uncharacterized protein n=1 Tax=Trichinella nativa TaxID=6335 RepID=A0A1Y3EC55_9BILA|nr:hypothetical protein D917_02811 [Trichinella nativa]